MPRIGISSATSRKQGDDRHGSSLRAGPTAPSRAPRYQASASVEHRVEQVPARSAPGTAPPCSTRSCGLPSGRHQVARAGHLAQLGLLPLLEVLHQLLLDLLGAPHARCCGRPAPSFPASDRSPAAAARARRTPPRAPAGAVQRVDVTLSGSCERTSRLSSAPVGPEQLAPAVTPNFVQHAVHPGLHDQPRPAGHRQLPVDAEPGVHRRREREVAQLAGARRRRPPSAAPRSRPPAGAARWARAAPARPPRSRLRSARCEPSRRPAGSRSARAVLHQAVAAQRASSMTSVAPSPTVTPEVRAPPCELRPRAVRGRCLERLGLPRVRASSPGRRAA